MKTEEGERNEERGREIERKKKTVTALALPI